MKKAVLISIQPKWVEKIANGDITYREYVIKYCPNCGAKVVYE